MSDFLLDNFTGTGTLTGHTSDSGHTWADAYGSEIDGLALDGAGNLNDTGTWQWWYYPKSSCPAPTGDYVLELDFTIDLSSNSWVGLMALNDADIYGGLDFGVGSNAGGPDWCSLYLKDATGSVTNSADANPTLTAGQHTLRVEVSESNGHFKGYLDGVLIHDLAAPGTALPAFVGFYMRRGDTTTYPSVSRIQGTGLAAPPPPEKFWTANVLTTEFMA